MTERPDRHELLAIARWTARENKIVMLQLLNHNNEEIGNIVGLGAARVGQILKDPRAEDVRRAFLAESKKAIAKTVHDKLELLAERSVDVLHTTIGADISATSKAKPNQDRVALKVLEGRQYLKSGDQPQRSGPIFSPEGEKKFLDMLERSNNVRAIDPFDKPPVTVVEEPEDDKG